MLSGHSLTVLPGQHSSQSMTSSNLVSSDTQFQVLFSSITLTRTRMCINTNVHCIGKVQTTAQWSRGPSHHAGIGDNEPYTFMDFAIIEMNVQKSTSK